MLLNDHTLNFNSLSDKDWEDIKFGVDNQVDFYAVSFVKDAKVVHELKNYLKSKFFFSFSSASGEISVKLTKLPNVLIACSADISVIVKIESADSIKNLPSIISACDGVGFKVFSMIRTS